MVKIIHLYPDMTFSEEEKKTMENKVKLGRIIDPSFKEGQAIFRERQLSIIRFWKKRRNLGIYMDGQLKLFSLETEILHSQFGTLEEIQKYIAGEIAKTKSKQKPMELWQFLVIIAMLSGIILLGLKTAGFINV